ncbi:hypothetical protein Rhal01_03609 [Rubritalea halochordaticola]|uniref:Uncharacterized protein n=1 Tax=Rubritalea halochordaticola TaxID=714537 RepID=A0ABP9V4F8_9BACT
MSQKPQNDIEKDPVWDLLGAASEQKPSPMFSRNVMRAIRLEEEPIPFWKRLLAPRPVITGLTAAAACIVLTVALMNDDQSPDQPSVASSPPSPAGTNVTDVVITSNAAIDQIASEYDVPEDLDDVIDPLMLISVMGDSSDYSLDELGL